MILSPDCDSVTYSSTKSRQRPPQTIPTTAATISWNSTVHLKTKNPDVILHIVSLKTYLIFFLFSGEHLTSNLWFLCWLMISLNRHLRRQPCCTKIYFLNILYIFIMYILRMFFLLLKCLTEYKCAIRSWFWCYFSPVQFSREMKAWCMCQCR